MTEPEELPACAHCSNAITRAQPIMVTTDAEGKEVAIHTECRPAFEKAKAKG